MNLSDSILKYQLKIKNGEEILKSLVIYYSFGGNCKLIADNIKDITGADLLELRPKKDFSSKGLSGFLESGQQVIANYKPELAEYAVDLLQYEYIYIGTPVWLGSYSSVLNTFFDQKEIKDKKIALYCCNSGAKGKVFEKMKERLNGNIIKTEMEFTSPNKKTREETYKKVYDWVNEFKSS